MWKDSVLFPNQTVSNSASSNFLKKILKEIEKLFDLFFPKRVNKLEEFWTIADDKQWKEAKEEEKDIREKRLSHLFSLKI